MATIVDNPKGFKVIETSRTEMMDVFGNLSICDYCNSAMFGNPNEIKGYLICVLNSWYCPACYEQWQKRAVNHPDDRAIEQRNFTAYSEIFRV